MKRIGEFQVIAEIHSGPISRVFRAFQPSLDRVVLVKTLHGRWVGEDDLVRQFEREARASARLSHANIVAVYACGTEDDIPYIAMEFVEGESVRDLLTRRGSLPVAVAVRIAREVCKGLEAAHAKGVLHRDIKPSNILLSVDGDVKIGDFGLAALLDVSRSEAESPAGTPAYMAPEQLRGEALSGRADLFSLGATLYEMVTGERAFAGRTPEECLRNVLQGTPPPPERLRPGLPLALSRLILETLAGDPAERPADAAALRRALDPFLKTRGTQIGREEIARCVLGEGPGDGLPDAVAPEPRSAPVPGVAPTRARNRTPLFAAFLLASAVGVAALIRGGIDGKMPEGGPSAAGRPVVPSGPALYRGPGATEEGPGGWTPAASFGPAVSPAGIDPLRVAERTPADVPPPWTKTPPAAELEAGIDIQCTPWAVVFLDGDSVDTTPLKRPIRLTPGVHLLELRNPTFPPLRREIRLEPGETRRLRLSLWDEVGRLQITVRPWARIYVDGRYRETTPLRDPLVLAPGTHHLHFEHASLEAMDAEMEIAAGEEIRFSVDLEKRLQERE